MGCSVLTWLYKLRSELSRPRKKRAGVAVWCLRWPRLTGTAPQIPRQGWWAYQAGLPLFETPFPISWIFCWVHTLLFTLRHCEHGLESPYATISTHIARPYSSHGSCLFQTQWLLASRGLAWGWGVFVFIFFSTPRAHRPQYVLQCACLVLTVSQNRSLAFFPRL